MQEGVFKISVLFQRIKIYVLEKSDPALLLFIFFMFNYRFSFKITAIIGIYLFRPDFKIKRDGIFYFYASMIFLSLVNILFVHRDYSYSHWMIVLAACLIWLTCLLSYHQVRLSVEKNDPIKIINTLKLFAICNFIVSLFDILKLMFITHSLNPYTQISPPPYGVSSGDMIGGIFGQLHLVNTVISCFLVIFFIYQRAFIYALICLLPFLLTGSNLATLVLIALLLYILFLKRELVLKYFAIFSILIIVIFYTKITPNNQQYLFKTLQTINKKKDIPVPVSPITNQVIVSEVKKLSKEELVNLFIQYKHRQHPDIAAKMNQQQLSILNKVDELNKTLKKVEAKEEMYFWYKRDSLQSAKLQSKFYDYGQLRKFDLDAEPGKITSFKQTAAYLKTSPANALFGAGAGSFSSRLAYVSSGIVGDSRVLEALPHYETPEFKDNHKALFRYLLFLDDVTHSITNLPFSWYNTLFGEYGLFGFLAFVIFYLGFFAKRFKLFSYGKIILGALLVFFLFDYWYERLSVVMLFELIMLLDLKIKTVKTNSEV